MAIQSRLAPAETCDEIHLKFLLDTTFSMDYIRNFLIELLDFLIPMIRVFPMIKLHVIAYNDWQKSRPRDIPIQDLGIATTEDQVRRIINQLRSIQAARGDDYPEATATAVYHAVTAFRTQCQESINRSKMIIINFTDAPPHNNGIIGSYDHQIRREQEYLMSKNFPHTWEGIAELLRTEGIQYIHCIDFENIATMANKYGNPRLKRFGKYIAAFPACLAGTAVNLKIPMTVGQYDAIQHHTMNYAIQTMLQLISLMINDGSDPIPVEHYRINCNTMIMFDNIQSIQRAANQHYPMATNNKLSLHNVQIDKNVMRDLYSDPNYRRQAISMLKMVITPNHLDRIMWLLEIPLYMQVYRLVMKDRSEENRSSSDAIKNAISRVMVLLPYDKQAMLRDALEKSLNNSEEINEMIRQPMQYATSVYIFDGKFLETDARRQILGIIKNFVGENKRRLIECLANIISRPIGKTNNVDNMNVIPTNVSNDILFQMIAHLIAPGTLLDKRLAAHMAILCCQFGIGTLKDRARAHLESIKGQWLTISKEDYPEYFGAATLSIFKNLNDKINFLTEHEWQVLEKYYVLTILRLRVNGVVELETHWDITDLPQRRMTCTVCNNNRTLDLVYDQTMCRICQGDMNVDDRYNITDEERQRRRRRKVEITGQSAKNLRRNNRNWWRHPSNPDNNTLNISTVPLQCSKCSITVQVTEQIHRYASLTWNCNGTGYHCTMCEIDNDHTIEFPQSIHTLSGTFTELLKTNSERNINRALGIRVTGARSTMEILTGTHYRIIDWGDKCVISTPQTTTLNFKGVPVTINNLREMMLLIESRQDCALCANELALVNIKYCGNSQCMTPQCQDCLTSWFSKNSPGQVFYQNGTTCPFCTMEPKGSILRKINPALCGLRVPQLDARTVYAWCISCRCVKGLAPRECAGEQPEVTDWECHDCIEERRLEEERRQQEADERRQQEEEPILGNYCACPGCGIAVVRTDGCNHMTCASCLIHWCYGCFLDGRTGRGIYRSRTFTQLIYDHSHNVHGTIYGIRRGYHNCQDDEYDTDNGEDNTGYDSD